MASAVIKVVLPKELVAAFLGGLGKLVDDDQVSQAFGACCGKTFLYQGVNYTLAEVDTHPGSYTLVVIPAPAKEAEKVADWWNADPPNTYWSPSTSAPPLSYGQNLASNVSNSNVSITLSVDTSGLSNALGWFQSGVSAPASPPAHLVGYYGEPVQIDPYELERQRILKEIASVYAISQQDIGEIDRNTNRTKGE